MIRRGPWVLVAVVLFISTALQAVVLVLSLLSGEPFPWRTLAGIVTLILGIFAIRQARRSGANPSQLDT